MTAIDKMQENVAHLKHRPEDVGHQMRHCEALIKAVMEHIRSLVAKQS